MFNKTYSPYLILLNTAKPLNYATISYVPKRITIEAENTFFQQKYTPPQNTTKAFTLGDRYQQLTPVLIRPNLIPDYID